MKRTKLTPIYALPNCTLKKGETAFCDNPLCENPAIETVSVSLELAGDSKRNYCAPCLEAYYVGVQHGRIETVA
jgi:hypothetical protein